MEATIVKIELVDCNNLAMNSARDEVNSRSFYVYEEKLRACRVCLSTDTKLYNLHEYELVEAFEEVTGIRISSTDGLPQHMCVMCSTLLQKSTAFRARCRKTNIFLQELLVKNPLITTEFVQNTDRKIFKLTFSTTAPETNDYIPKTESQNVKGRTTRKRKCKEKHLDNELNDVVKEEVFIESNSADDKIDADNIADFDDENASLDEYLAPDFYIANKRDGEKIETDIKSEDNVDSTDVYSLRSKKNKRKLLTDLTEEVKKKKSKTKKVKDELIDANLENLKDNVVVPKKKRMFNRNSEEDFKSFAKMYNADVIFLTREQQMAELQARKESEDYISARFQCKECYRSFMKESAYTKHMTWHDPSSGSHVCDICKIRYPTRTKLLSHIRRHRMHFICQVCNTISKETATAKLHYKWHEGFKYECKHCGKKFNKSSTYMNHVRENHSALTCELCGEPVQGTRGLTAHKASLHAGKFKCSSCDAQFHSKEALTRHIENITDDGCDPCVKPCAQCGASFLTAQMLLEHISLAHKDKIFRCEKCNTIYSSDRQLGIHWSRAHKGQRRGARSGDAEYMCEVCGKNYANETLLRYHQRLHTGEKPFECTMCPKRFRTKINLQVHLNTHTGARPYKCALCPETFKSYAQKHKHKLLVHTKERRYKCHMCEKTYVVSCDLKMHIRTAHMKIPLPPRKRRRNQPPKLVERTAVGATKSSSGDRASEDVA